MLARCCGHVNVPLLNSIRIIRMPSFPPTDSRQKGLEGRAWGEKGEGRRTPEIGVMV
jgi:hypothetical protein